MPEVYFEMASTDAINRAEQNEFGMTTKWVRNAEILALNMYNGHRNPCQEKKILRETIKIG